MKWWSILGLGLLVATGATAQDDSSPVPPPTPPTREANTSAPIAKDWPGVEYAEIRAYLYYPGAGPGNFILRAGKLHPEVVNPEGIKLDATQTAQLLQAIRYRAPDRRGVGCFLPHHGIVFYGADGKPVADLTICFLCEVVTEGPFGGETMDWDLTDLAKLMRDLGLPVFETFDEADSHFIALARQWPDAKVKEALDKYLLSDSKALDFDDFNLLHLLQGLGERTHPFLLTYLADKERHNEWIKVNPAGPQFKSRFHRLCDAFGDIPPSASVPLLAPFLDVEDVSTRCDAAFTIAKTGVTEIVPLVRKAFSDSGDEVALNALEGLLVAIHRGALHAEARTQLFPDVEELDAESADEKRWAKVLLGLDSNKAVEFFLSGDNFKANSPRLRYVLEALCELNVQIPRERILALAAELRAQGIGREEGNILEPALRLLGRQRHPDDLELLRGMGDETFARSAMPGLLAWHGLEGYRERLSKLEEEKGFAALNEHQRLHFAAYKFETRAYDIGSYFSGPGCDQYRDALTGLKAMRCDKLVAILEEAVAKFGKEGPASDEVARQEQLDVLKKNRAFEELDQRGREALKLWSLALDRYAVEHAGSFK